MRKSHLAALLVLSLGLEVTIQNSEAKPWSDRKIERADKNNDGRIGPRELKRENRRVRARSARVDTPRERRADLNNDGFVNLKERDVARGKKYLKHRSDVDKKWEVQADTNQDGVVDRSELRNQLLETVDKNNDGVVSPRERKKFAMHHKSKVNTKAEERYDTDKDGFINRSEARELLRDRLRIINTHGRAVANTDLEREFDSNNDGIIDRDEANLLRDSLNE